MSTVPPLITFNVPSGRTSNFEPSDTVQAAGAHAGDGMTNRSWSLTTSFSLVSPPSEIRPPSGEMAIWVGIRSAFGERSAHPDSSTAPARNVVTGVPPTANSLISLMPLFSSVDPFAAFSPTLNTASTL